MRYKESEKIMSPARMRRSVTACGNDTRKAMTLYRLNLRLSQELFTVISCFEISLRNAVNNYLVTTIGTDWLKNGVARGGLFDSPATRLTATNIRDAVRKLNRAYTPTNW
jgi:hypothetical protein